MKKLLSVGLVCSFFFTISPLYSQTINHWETVVFETDTWRYFVGTSEPDTNWRKLTFNDGGWSSGIGGFGFGDGDDNTIIPSTVSLYIRKSFNIVDTSKIEQVVLDIDYDDAFVAYLNNVEIARSNIGTVGDHPPFNQLASSQHEAQMYQAGNPEQFLINNQLLKSILQQGNNVLTIQIHNATVSSSDLSARPFLSLGINDVSSNYFPTPTWFQPPLVFTSSNLPIVVINTNGQTIGDNFRIVADMGIIYNPNGVRNFMTDPFNEYNDKISIEKRGSSSQMFPKKSYSLETQDIFGNNNNVAIMDMPSENDWVLYAPYSDKSLVRNVLTYHFGGKLGRYSPRTKLCELVLNNEYQGVYVFTEKIKRDKDRVDIAKLDLDDLAGDSLTGGYIVKIDKTTSSQGLDWTSPIAPPNAGSQQIGFQFHYPDQIDILPLQANYIENYITNFEYALNGPNFTDSVLGYRNYIDVISFIDFFIINELSRNVDGYRLSTYLFKDKDSKGGKINMGPIWDFNLGFANINYCDGALTTGWAVDFNYTCPSDNYLIPFWWEKLAQDTTYNNQLRCRWDNLRLNELHLDSILFYVDTLAALLNESQQRNFQKWNILNTYVWPNNYIGGSYSNEINYLKTWITNRVTWLDNNMPGNCYNVGINENNIEAGISVYPNPATTLINIKSDKNDNTVKQVRIFDSRGKSVYNNVTYNKLLQVDISSFSSGLYLIEVSSDNGHYIKKLLKQ